MLTRLTPFPLLFSILIAACTSPSPVSTISELDFMQVADNSGWSLKVYGNGSGSISHVQLPAHHLHYPKGTFTVRGPRQMAEGCSDGATPPLCSRLSYYSSRLDSTFHCTCVSAAWTEKLMSVAVDNMGRALEAGGDLRSCRMLRRRWLSPSAGLSSNNQ